MSEELKADDLIARFDHPETPDRTHTPELERWAYNQMPKSGWRELKLYRFDGSDLFQWWGKRGKDSNSRDWSPFEDSATDVFIIKSRNAGKAEPVGLSIETQTIIDDAERLANRMGATLVLDPERVAKFDRPHHPHPPQPSPGVGEAVERLTEFDDLAEVIRRALVNTGEDFPNYADWPVSLPMGHWRAILPALSALSHQTPARVEAEEFQPTHRHVKRGSEYQVVGLGILQAEGPWDNAAVAIYRDAEGTTWVRPTLEFDDGRFVKLADERAAHQKGGE